MTENEALDMLKARLKCTELDDLACFEKGCDRKCEKCDLNYEQGNHGQRKEAMAVAIKALEEIQQYRAIGTVEECREARERQRAKKPIYKHYEEGGEPTYIKIACPNGCRIQLYPVTQKNFAHEHVFCPKCGQKLDWSDTD